MRLDDFQLGRSGVARVSAQMFVSPDRWTGSIDHDGSKHWLQLGDVMSVGSGHDERQRDATPVHQQMALAPIPPRSVGFGRQSLHETTDGRRRNPNSQTARSCKRSSAGRLIYLF